MSLPFLANQNVGATAPWPWDDLRHRLLGGVCGHRIGTPNESFRYCLHNILLKYIIQYCAASEDCFFTRVVCQIQYAHWLVCSQALSQAPWKATIRHTGVVRAGAKCCVKTMLSEPSPSVPCIQSGSHELEPLSQVILCSQHVRTAVPNMTQPASSCELVGPVLNFQIRYLKAAKPFKNDKTCHIKSCQISGSYYEAPNVSLCPVTEPKQCHTGCERSYSHSDLAILGPGSWIIRECQATNVNINSFV